MKTLKLLLSTFMLCAMSCAITVHAAVVAFEATGQSGACGGAQTGTISDGFTFTSVHHHICDSSRPDLVANGTNFLGADVASVVTMTRTNGATFALNSVDLAELFGLSAAAVRVGGNVSGGGSVSTTFTLDGAFDGPGGIADFETFLLGSEFSNLSSVTFTALGSTGGLVTNFSIDNIVVDDSGQNVPEPGSLVLLALGLAGLGTVRRRKA